MEISGRFQVTKVDEIQGGLGKYIFPACPEFSTTPAFDRWFPLPAKLFCLWSG
jgi:hypothetical protein